MEARAIVWVNTELARDGIIVNGAETRERLEKALKITSRSAMHHLS